MTVSELIKYLSKQPDDAEVQLGDDDDIYIFDSQLGIIAHIK